LLANTDKKVTGQIRRQQALTPVSLDPRYGTFDGKSFAAPVSPPAATVPNPTVNTAITLG
jgi:hypothetical protein